jgi:hypothetical protein
MHSIFPRSHAAADATCSTSACVYYWSQPNQCNTGDVGLLHFDDYGNDKVLILQSFATWKFFILIHNAFAEYPRAESAAKVIAEELGMNHAWKDITFKKATREDTGRIQLALQDEDAEPTSSDWAVKMGINIYYSAKQSKSPLYSKQVPYNSIIYKAFAQENPDSFADGQRSSTTKKKVAGWWCGKKWMSNQVHPLLACEQVEQNHETVYSKTMLSASCDRMQEQSTRSTTLINQNSSKKITRRKEGDSVEKSRGKKKRCSASASDEAALHCSVYDQPVNSDNHAKYEDGDESESVEARNTRHHQQYESLNKKSSLKRRKDNNRSNSFHELHKDNVDIDCRFDTDGTENTSIGDWDNSPPQGGDVKAVKSGARLLGTKRFSKEKGSNGLSNVNKKLVKMGKKISTKKQKNDKTNRQFQENHKKADIVDLLHEDDGDEGTYIDCNEIRKQKTDDVRVKSRGKMQSGKKKVSRCQASDGSHNGGKEMKLSSDIEVCNRRGDGTTAANFEEIPKEKADAVKVKPKMQGDKKKTSKHQAGDGDKGAKFSCDIEGCDMSFSTQHDLSLHKRDICPVKGCKKKFFCHKYLLQHRKVHLDERPLMCSFPGCAKTFKWPWARTEHMRVHTGVRPYACTEPGCTQTFRFVSDFSRHKRKTGHSCDKKKKRGL